MAGSLIAMDAEQERDADGRWHSEGGGVERFRDKQGVPLGHVEPAGVKPAYHGHSVSGGHVGSWNNKDNAKKGMEKHFNASPAQQAKHRSTGAYDTDPFAVDDTSALQGEAGRQARQLARDCMSGRFRR